MQNPSAQRPFSALIFIFCKFGLTNISAGYSNSVQTATERVFTGHHFLKQGYKWTLNTFTPKHKKDVSNDAPTSCSAIDRMEGERWRSEDS